jgi:hypothetical protein
MRQVLVLGWKGASLGPYNRFWQQSGGICTVGEDGAVWKGKLGEEEWHERGQHNLGRGCARKMADRERSGAEESLGKSHAAFKEPVASVHRPSEAD